MHGKSIKGFTLIEMAVVLVIIGLIVSGIIIGQSMIRSSKVQTIVSDVSNFQSAVVQFKQKYNEMPGDMADATNYWGVNPNCATAGGAGTGTQTCNGNGDGQIAVSFGPPYEQFLVWQHLANAGMITGQYVGSSNPNGTYDYCAAGVNCPGGSVIPSQSYYLSYWNTSSGPPFNGLTWSEVSGHYLLVGAMGSTTNANSFPAWPLLSAPEALSLDSKVDDGSPYQGVWKTFGGYKPPPGYQKYINNCVVTTGTTTIPPLAPVPTSPVSYNTAYGDTPACSMQIMMNF